MKQLKMPIGFLSEKQKQEQEEQKQYEDDSVELLDLLESILYWQKPAVGSQIIHTIKKYLLQLLWKDENNNKV